jgi:hypothetical protein
MKLVPLYDSGQNIGSVPLTTNLDAWDGMRWRFQRTGCHQHYAGILNLL